MIGPFRDENRYLSNFYISPFEINGVKYRTVEHFYQSMKTVIPGERVQVINANSPGNAKRLGRNVTIRNDWDEVKIWVMTLGVYSKFSQNRHLADKLLATGGEELVELNNWHDNYWGYCSCRKCINVKSRNKLGKTLMLVRNLLKG